MNFSDAMCSLSWQYIPRARSCHLASLSRHAPQLDRPAGGICVAGCIMRDNRSGHIHISAPIEFRE
jgi:ribosomal protein L34E